MGAAIHATWAEVAARQAAGEERWGGADGERGFWRRFVEKAYHRLGGGEFPEPLLDELIAHFRQEQHWVVYPEVRDVLARLRDLGLSLHVVSNWDSSLPGLLDRLGLTPAFDNVVVSALVGVSKPEKGIFDVALGLAGVGPEEGLHVGDSPTDDYEGARRAGLAALLLDRAGYAPESMETIRSLSELVDRLGP